MSDQSIFVFSARVDEDLAGVFEYDGETGYFYLYGLNRSEGNKILDAILIYDGDAGLAEDDIVVTWDHAQQRVGLVLNGALWAVFNVPNGSKSGGSYVEGGIPQLAPGDALDSRWYSGQ